MKVYWQVTNGGDGSYGVEFFNSYECIETLQKNDNLYEWYPAESDGSFEVMAFGHNLDIKNMADVQQIIEEYTWDE